MPKSIPKYVVLWRRQRKGDRIPDSFFSGGKQRYKDDEWEVVEESCTLATATKCRKDLLTPAPADEPDSKQWDSRPADILVLPLSAAVSFS